MDEKTKEMLYAIGNIIILSISVFAMMALYILSI